MSPRYDQVSVKNLSLQGIIGIYPHEREKKQPISVSFTVWCDTQKAAKSDEITDAVNYHSISTLIEEHVSRAKPFLIERLIGELVEIIFESDPRIHALKLTVEKPDALANADSVGVTVFRRRGSH